MKPMMSALALAWVLAVVAARAHSAQLCHTATINQDKPLIRFCVDPDQQRVTQYSAGNARILRPFDQQRTEEAVTATMILGPGRRDPATRVTSRYLLRDLPNDLAQNAKRGQAAYQLCTWSAETSCGTQDPARGPQRCWKPCSAWYGYLPGLETPD
jgi:hypothetical protein